jgi:outer membrane receptor for Fe3+-dicitrate
MKLFIALFISILSFIAAKTQTAKGRVIDAITNQPLESAVIEDSLNKTIATSDREGHFTISGIGEHTHLKILFIGYITGSFTTDGKDFCIKLQPDIVDLKDITLSANNKQRFGIISRIDLSLKPVRTTQDLMRIVPGLFIAQHAGGGKAEQIFLRGFDADHGTDVQVSVDDLPVNMVSHAHGQGYADAHFIIPETVGNVDFGTGPYYTDHGNFNTAGYINFKTFNRIPKSRIQTEFGSFNTYRVLGMIDLLKKNPDRQNAFVAAEANYTNGPTENKQNFSRFNLFSKYNYRFSERTHLSASVSGFKSNWNASGQIPERAVKNGLINRFGSIDPNEGGRTERYNINVILSGKTGYNTTLQNQLFYSHYLFDLLSDFTFYLNDPVNGDMIRQSEKRDVYGYNAKLATQWNIKKLSLESEIRTGFRYDATSNSALSHVHKNELLDRFALGDINEINAFASAQQRLTFGKLHIESGVRLDHLNFRYSDKLTGLSNTSHTSVISPKLNIQYDAFKYLLVYFKAGKGFHSNDSRVVAQQQKEISPSAFGSDIGMILKPAGNIYINVAAWYLVLQQEFVYVGDEGITEPSGKTIRKGIDVLARYQFTKNLFANIDVNITKAISAAAPKGNNYIPLAPLFTSTGGLFYKRKTGFNAGLSYRWIKNRPANEDNSIVAKGYFLLDGCVNYTKPKYEIGISFENILNTQWNEAQFATGSRLKDEPAPVTELHFTPGTPLAARIKFAVFF